MDISALDQAIGKTNSGKGRELSLAAIARATFMNEMKEAADRSFRDSSPLDATRPAASQMKHLAFKSDPLPAPRWEPASQKTRSAFSDEGTEDRVRAETDPTEPLNARSKQDNPEDETVEAGSMEHATVDNPMGENRPQGDSVLAPKGAPESPVAKGPTLQTSTPESGDTNPKAEMTANAVVPDAVVQDAPVADAVVPDAVVPDAAVAGAVMADATDTVGDGMPAVPQSTPLPAAFSDGIPPKGAAAAGSGGQSAAPPPAPAVPGQNPLSQTSAQAPGPKPSQNPAISDAMNAPVKSAETAQAAQGAQAAAQVKDGAITKPSIDTNTSIKISVDAAPQTTSQVKALPSTGGTLFQAQQAAATGMAQSGVTLPSPGQSAIGAAAAQGASHANGGQPLFVGADGGAQTQNAGANGGQAGGQQNPQGGGQGAAG